MTLKIKFQTAFLFSFQYCSRMHIVPGNENENENGFIALSFSILTFTIKTHRYTTEWHNGFVELQDNLDKVP